MVIEAGWCDTLNDRRPSEAMRALSDSIGGQRQRKKYTRALGGRELSRPGGSLVVVLARIVARVLEKKLRGGFQKQKRAWRDTDRCVHVRDPGPPGLSLEGARISSRVQSP